MRYAPDTKRLLHADSRGITGLETAIVLIAFVVVSSVFAFAALSTGLFSSDKSKETINAGLTEASGTLEIRGSITAKAFAVVNEMAATHTADGAVTVLSALANLPVVGESDTVTLQPAATDLTRVASSPASAQYSINNTTGVVTLGTALTTGDSIEVDYSAGIVDEMSLQVANAAGGRRPDPRRDNHYLHRFGPVAHPSHRRRHRHRTGQRRHRQAGEAGGDV